MAEISLTPPDPLDSDEHRREHVETARSLGEHDAEIEDLEEALEEAEEQLEEIQSASDTAVANDSDQSARIAELEAEIAALQAAAAITVAVAEECLDELEEEAEEIEDELPTETEDTIELTEEGSTGEHTEGRDAGGVQPEGAGTPEPEEQPRGDDTTRRRHRFGKRA